MRRLLFAAALFAVPVAHAQTSTDAHVARAVEVIEIIAEASSLTPAPPVPSDPAKYVAALDAVVAAMRADRPKIRSLRDRLVALPPLEPGDDPELHASTAGLQSFGVRILDTLLTMGNDLEEFALAFHARDDARFEAANARLRTSVVVSLESMVATTRGLKVATAWGDPAEMAKIETMALVVESLLALTRYRLELIPARQAGDLLIAHADSIAKELPTARSELEKDARTFGDDPLNPPTLLVQINRVDWKMLEIVEAFGEAADALGRRMSNGQASRAEIDNGYRDLRAQMNEVRTLYAEVTTLGIESLGGGGSGN